MLTVFMSFSILFVFCLILISYFVYKKNLHIWIPSYVAQIIGNLFNKPAVNPLEPIHIYFCFADHFEPKWQNVPQVQQKARVDKWCQMYPQLVRGHEDSEGRCPQHTFFYPEEEYEEEYLGKLGHLCKQGYGDVEIHLHHNDDTAENLARKLLQFKDLLYETHGLLRKDKQSKEITYGFIHGNWALDNSRRDGKMCGVNNELQVLRETGCYADFTLPSAPSDTQTRKINSIYYAVDDPDKPKSHNKGTDVQVGKETDADLMIIQGPLTLNWKRRKYSIFPRIENGEISQMNPPTKHRVDLWIKQHICVKGEPNNIFVKIHCHGAQEQDFATLLGKPIDDMFLYLETYYNDGKKYVLHYVTTWELYNIVKTIERVDTNRV